MADKVHSLTDEKLVQMEKRISAIYQTAQKDIEKKAEEYFKKFEKADEEKRKLVEKGKLTEKEYQQWRQNKLMYGKRFTAMKEDISKQLLNVNQTATAYINGELPEVYALNYNALADTVDGVGGYSFTLTDANTVRHLATTDKSLLPFRELDPAKDIPWNMKKINSEVLQGIIQGESIPNIAKRIKNVEEMNKNASIRSARTIVTSAENKGRMDSYHKAEEDGIILEKQWLSAIDSRTRDWHIELNGKTKPVDEPFENAIGKIMFPGDPSADGANVYNCRCTLVSVVKGFKNAKYAETIAEAKETENTTFRKIVDGQDISNTWQRRSDEFDFEIEDVMNAQGFDGLPKVVSKKEFNKSVKDSKFIAQRTYSAPDQETLEAYRDQLYNGKWYVDCSTGGAQYGQGMYCAADYKGKLTEGIKSEMKDYQELNKSRGNNFSFIETFTLDKSAKIITYDDALIEKNNLIKNSAIKEAKSIWENKDAISEMKKSIKNVLDVDITDKEAQEFIKSRILTSDMTGAFVDEQFGMGEARKKYMDFRHEHQINLRKSLDIWEPMRPYIEDRFVQTQELKKMDLGACMSLKGYDAINAEGHGDSGSYTVILNRTKCIILGE